MTNTQHIAIVSNSATDPDKQLGDLLPSVPSSIGEAVVLADINTNILFMNNMAEKLTGYAYTKIRGKPAEELFRIIDERSGAQIDFPAGEKIKPDGFVRFGEYSTLVVKNGRSLSIAGSAAPIISKNGDIHGLVIIFYNTTRQRRMAKQLEYISMHDPLTGLYNRAYFEYETSCLQSKQALSVGLIVCDIDGLKIINDSLGHKTGDQMLVSVAQILKKSFAEKDIVARIGGDEFAVLLPNGYIQAAYEACRRVRKNVAKYNELNNGLPVSISLGFAAGPTSSDISELFKEADQNMYKEKLHHSRSIRSTVVSTIMRMIGAKDFISEGHCERAKNLMELMAFTLGLSEDKFNDLRLLAEFHDIGKVGIADAILLKQGPLTPSERKEMQRHCEIGRHIAMSSPDLAHIANWILSHHEWWNGAGYPRGIAGVQIPVECRMLAIIDAYDAMTNNRPYRRAMSVPAALAELKKGAGSQFDPALVSAFTSIIEALKIYVAASVKDAMREAKQVYIRDNPGSKLLLRFGGSGTLQQQIAQGAPADIFIPAASRPMDELQEQDCLINETRKDLLQNKVVLVTAVNSNTACRFSELAAEKVKNIALGDPVTVPAGKYAQEVLTSLGIWDSVKPKLVFAEDVRHVLKLVETEYTNVGIVYQTDAIISGKVKILDRAPANSHAPVVYPVAVVKGSIHHEECRRFIGFLSSEKGSAIFAKYGFIICSDSADCTHRND